MDDTKHLSAEMLYYMFESANMHRWNDHYRTIDLTEIDKQAHKVAIAWYLGKCEERKGRSVNWHILIEHSLFAFIHRIAITDLKPPVYYELIKKEENRRAINRYAYEQFSERVPSMDRDFLARFRAYIDEGSDLPEDHIVSAAHYLATRYEFNLIEEVNSSVIDIMETKKEIEDQLEGYRKYDLAGLSLPPEEDRKFQDFIKLVGQLRCQQRWARIPREPKTTVLGHCIFVANSVFLNDLDHGVTDARRIYNDYYSGLFHDLPEVLTKDVITPVKSSSKDITESLGDIEIMMFNKKVLPLMLDGHWVSELGNMALRPFEAVKGFDRDHESIKACDMLAAWIEAYVSIQYGVSSKMLRDAKVQTGYALIADPRGAKIGVSQILSDFEKMSI